MNPLTNVKNISKLNEIELERGLIDKSSWHDMYKDSAWIFIGGLSYGMTEGDVLAVFSQYGEVVNINMVRDKKTGKIKGFCFLCYANQKSTVLAVDNFNGIKLCGRTIRVDHVANYKVPKEHENDDEITKALMDQGCAPKPVAEPSPDVESEKGAQSKFKEVKKEKRKKKRRESPSSSSTSSSSSSSSSESEADESEPEIRIKKEKHDPGYDKYDSSKASSTSAKVHQRPEKTSKQRRHDDSDSSDRKYKKSKHSLNRNELLESGYGDYKNRSRLNRSKSPHSGREDEYKTGMKHSSIHSQREKHHSNSSSKAKHRDLEDDNKIRQQPKSRSRRRHSASDSSQSSNSSGDDEDSHSKSKYKKRRDLPDVDQSKWDHEPSKRHKSREAHERSDKTSSMQSTNVDKHRSKSRTSDKIYDNGNDRSRSSHKKHSSHSRSRHS